MVMVYSATSPDTPAWESGTLLEKSSVTCTEPLQTSVLYQWDVRGQHIVQNSDASVVSVAIPCNPNNFFGPLSNNGFYHFSIMPPQ